MSDAGHGSTQPIIRQPATCAGCGGQFFDRHFCPHMPWGQTAPLPTFIPIQGTIKGV